MYHTLVGVDDDEERAVAQANAVIELPNADGDVTAHLCHVFQDNTEGASIGQVSGVRRARERLEGAGVACEHYEASGDPATEIIAAARATDVDAICLSGRKRSPAGKVVFGSVTQEVILSADRPVLAVPRTEE